MIQLPQNISVGVSTDMLECWRDGSVGKALAVQTRGLEFSKPALHRATNLLNPRTGWGPHSGGSQGLTGQLLSPKQQSPNLERNLVSKKKKADSNRELMLSSELPCSQMGKHTNTHTCTHRHTLICMYLMKNYQTTRQLRICINELQSENQTDIFIRALAATAKRLKNIWAM